MCTIHAPEMPTSANANGSTQQLDASSAARPAIVSAGAVLRLPSVVGVIGSRAVVVMRAKRQALISRAVIWYAKLSGSYGSRAAPPLSACGYMKKPSLPRLAPGNAMSLAVL